MAKVRKGPFKDKLSSSRGTNGRHARWKKGKRGVNRRPGFGLILWSLSSGTLRTTKKKGARKNA